MEDLIFVQKCKFSTNKWIYNVIKYQFYEHSWPTYWPFSALPASPLFKKQSLKKSDAFTFNLPSISFLLQKENDENFHVTTVRKR
jgi:hypothetical protein